VAATPLARLLLALYVLLTGYATLYPLAGWRDPGVSAFAFLLAGWPKYLTAFDLAANVLAYVPFGLFCAAALYPAMRGGLAVLAAAASGAMLSLGLEAAQSFLPTRIPSNLDVLANLAGACVGGVAGARLAPYLLEGGRLASLRAALFEHRVAADAGMTLAGLWLFSQLNPATLLFGSGDLRDLLESPGGPAYAAQFFAATEAIVTAANMTAFGLLVSAMLKKGAPHARTLLVTLLSLALGVKTLGFAILMRAENVFAWLTPGALGGLVAGTVLLVLLARLPRTLRLALAAVLIMTATVLVNLAPPNPYLAETLKVWQQGHFLHFNGLTRLVSAAWPFAALAYLIFLAARRGRGREREPRQRG
jgi:VanZ family protein